MLGGHDDGQEPAPLELSARGFLENPGWARPREVASNTPPVLSAALSGGGTFPDTFARGVYAGRSARPAVLERRPLPPGSPSPVDCRWR